MTTKRDAAQSGFDVVQAVIQRTEAIRPMDAPKNPAAVALGRLGGLKGGPARAKALTKAQRSAIGKKAAASRWNRKKAQ